MSASGARAAYTVIYSQDGADVVASGHGTLDLDALSFVETSSGYATGQVFPSIGTRSRDQRRCMER